jgi:hypothetical protein
MSKLDIINAEIQRRTEFSEQLKNGQADLLAAQEQFSKLDEMYREDEKKYRDQLECLYKEAKHFTGKWPKVYSFANTEYYPFFNGMLDDDCNPYFPISKIKNKTFDGLSPLYVAPTGGSGVWARDRNYSGPLEPSLRTVALNAIAAFPDISAEIPACSDPALTTESTCTAGGGAWGYAAGSTATEKLRAAVTPWRDKLVNDVIPDLCSNGSPGLSFWQDLVSKLNTILSAVVSDVSYPNHTSDFASGSPADTARDYFVSSASSINQTITNRINYLASESSKEEQLFFGIVKLRLNQASGSFSKLNAVKNQINTNKSIIKDNIDAVASLNIMKVKSS